jgi:hypothetical protein
MPYVAGAYGTVPPTRLLATISTTPWTPAVVDLDDPAPEAI